MTELEVNLKKSIIHKIIGRNIGWWGSKHCSSFVRLALSMSEINENVFNIEIIRYLRKTYPAFKSFFIVSNHFFLHTEQLLKANITELDQTVIQDIAFVQAISLFTSLQGFHTLHNPDSSCSIILKNLAYPDSN